MVLSCSDTSSACGSGARAVLKLRALGGEEGVDMAPSAPAHPPDRVRSAKPEPRPKPGADHSDLIAQPVEPKPQESPSGSKSTSSMAMDALRRRSVKPTPRTRQGGRNMSQNTVAVVGESLGPDASSIQETLLGLASVIGRRDETNAVPCTRTSGGLENVATNEPTLQLDEEAIIIQPYESEHVLNHAGIARTPSFGDDHFHVREEIAGDCCADAASPLSDTAVARTSICGADDNVRGHAMPAGTVHYKTMLNLPDISEFSDDTSSDEFDDLDDLDLP